MNLSSGPDAESQFFERMGQFVAGASPELASLWAKSGDETGSLSLPQHLADAACVAWRLWDRWVADSVKRSLAASSNMAEDDVRATVVFLAGVHDVAKATRRFSRQIEHEERGRLLVDDIVATGLPMEMSDLEAESRGFAHGLAGEVLLTSWLKGEGCPKRMAGALGSVIGAHHGISSSVDDQRDASWILEQYPPQWTALHVEIFESMAAATGFGELIGKLPRRVAADYLQRVAGIVVMADWIASNADAFPMVCSGSQAERVRDGVDSIGLTLPWNVQFDPDVGLDDFFRRAFGWPSKFVARPVQKKSVEAVGPVNGPCLVIIEAPTGEGKTEAALAVGQRLAAASRAQGLLLAAPTMGTSNGMFSRVVDWAERNTPEFDVTSMNLVHSRSALSEDFRRLRVRDVGEDSGGEHGAVVANQWLGGSKKSMLSNFVVSTVDQVLMMALQMRYSMLRHLGLAGKVIIVDEVHSYDLYMGSYLRTALAWLARYGVSVVLLSATLSQETKLSLIDAYGAQFHEKAPEKLSTAYPLITVVDAEGVVEVEVPSRPTDMEASVEIIDDSLEHLVDRVNGLVAEGGCALIICNTIRRAQEAYQQLTDLHPGEVELHHSAFLANERASKEDRLRSELGPDAHRGHGRPYRKIICATQVAEQSLDIDADVLITDIAPMDLLIQRIGRMHRHQRPMEDRPSTLQKPQVYVRGILEMDPVPVFEGGSSAVYEPAILMSTLAHLPQTYRRPDDISSLVQNTYSPEFVPPDNWAEDYGRYLSTLRKNQSLSDSRARTFQIPHPKDASKLSQLFERYHQSMGELTPLGEEAGAAQVRDTDPTIEVIPIVDTAYGYRPMTGSASDTGAEYVDGTELDWTTAFGLASSVVRLPASLTRFPRDFDEVITQLERETPTGWARHYLLRGQVALRLDEKGEAILNGRRLRYTSELGLELQRREETYA